jgi:hypothetical protein
MFNVTSRQQSTFHQASLSAFEEEMVERCAELAPAVSAGLGPERLVTALRAAIARAAEHGFTLRGPVRLFIELRFLLGSAFDADVQYPWARDCLARSGETREVGSDLEQMDCAAVLHAASIDALNEIQGPDDSHVDAALGRLLALATEQLPSAAFDLPELALAAMEHVHPDKYAFVGAPALRDLIAAGTTEATRHGLSESRDVALIIGLMFAYGQGCTEDPLLPWIGATLADEAAATPALRARKLEEAALTAARAALAGA